MDERWAKALRAKGIGVGGDGRHHGGRAIDVPHGTVRNQSYVTGAAVSRARPFKATGHKGGISRQGS
ncbi:hypothetical protein [Bifidobacterium ramosum]|uniref:Uncharacterized protein n=1 Tax=Bifidobacterium ramosum TaxID=1798158 RepID=A0A7K3TE47_9BIFI|nr:hypothetical protein [Bifidobacterium ramosum]NEG72831.1 hypothetical protein [Bifidobacterium ramosum]